MYVVFFIDKALIYVPFLFDLLILTVDSDEF